MFIECCAMQLAIMLEPALMSPGPAPARLLSSVMQRLVRWARCAQEATPPHVVCHVFSALKTD